MKTHKSSVDEPNQTAGSTDLRESSFNAVESLIFPQWFAVKNKPGSWKLPVSLCDISGSCKVMMITYIDVLPEGAIEHLRISTLKYELSNRKH